MSTTGGRACFLNVRVGEDYRPIPVEGIAGSFARTVWHVSVLIVSILPPEQKFQRDYGIRVPSAAEQMIDGCH